MCASSCIYMQRKPETKLRCVSSRAVHLAFVCLVGLVSVLFIHFFGGGAGGVSICLNFISIFNMWIWYV